MMIIRTILMAYFLGTVCMLSAMTDAKHQAGPQDQIMDKAKDKSVRFSEDMPTELRTMFSNIDTLVNLTKTVFNTRKSCRGQMRVIYEVSQHAKDPRLAEQWDRAHASREQFVRDANNLLTAIKHEDFGKQMRAWLKNIGFDLNREGPYTYDDFYNDASNEVLEGFETVVKEFKASLWRVPDRDKEEESHEGEGDEGDEESHEEINVLF